MLVAGFDYRLIVPMLCSVLLLAACGDGGRDAVPVPAVLPAAPVLQLQAAPKQLLFSWASVPGATHYRLLQDPTGASGFAQIGADHPATDTAAELDIAAHRLDWMHVRYRLAACNSAGCSASTPIAAVDAMVDAIGFVKASNPDAHDHFGSALALSADGNTLAVAAPSEDSTAQEVDGDQSNDGNALNVNAGAVYVFVRGPNGRWAQQAYLKAANSNANDEFGYALALSADGNTLVVGAPFEDSSASAIDGDPGNANDDASFNAGAAYVFVRDDGHWTQQAYLKAFNTDREDLFGLAVSISGDGNTVAVSAPFEDSAAHQLDGDPGNSSLATNSGAVYVFARDAAHWSQRAYVKPSNTDRLDQFGAALALSSDGNTLAVGAPLEDSLAREVNGDDGGSSFNDNAGAVYVFARDRNGPWSQQAYVKASNTDRGDQFGLSVSLSGDGNTLAVGAAFEDSNATGIEGDPDDNSEVDPGAAYVFVRDPLHQWAQEAYVKASNTASRDFFGLVALSADGNTLAVSASQEDSSAVGVGGDDSDDNGTNSGAVYVFTRSASGWTPLSYVKASNPDLGDAFGTSVGISGDGKTLAVGAWQESSAATGVGGTPDELAEDSGAVYLY